MTRTVRFALYAAFACSAAIAAALQSYYGAALICAAGATVITLADVRAGRFN